MDAVSYFAVLLPVSYTHLIQVAEVQNDEIRHVLEDSENQSDEYIEQYVRKELGYAKPGERIFVNIAGN